MQAFKRVLDLICKGKGEGLKGIKLFINSFKRIPTLSNFVHLSSFENVQNMIQNGYFFTKNHKNRLATGGKPLAVIRLGYISLLSATTR